MLSEGSQTQSPYHVLPHACNTRKVAYNMSLWKSFRGVGKMVQEVKLLVAKPDDPNLFPWAHLEEGESRL